VPTQLVKDDAPVAREADRIHHVTRVGEHERRMERDIVTARELTGDIGPNKLKQESVRVISTRFWATLGPGLKALESFAQLVPDWEAIEAAAWESVDSILPKRGGTLREHLASMISESERLRIN